MALALSSCQTTGVGVESGTGSGSQHKVAKEFYTPFFDQKDHLTELITANKPDDASMLYAELRAWYDTNAKTDPELSSALTTLVEQTNAQFEPALQKSLSVLRAIQWPSPSSGWKAVRSAIDDARTALNAVPSGGIYVNPEFQPGTQKSLALVLDEVQGKTGKTAVDDFKAFDFSATNGFFDIHPSARHAKAFFSEHPGLIQESVAGRSASEIANFAKNIGKDNVSPAQWKAISTAYADAKISRLSAKSKSLADILSIFSEAKAAGFDIDSVPSAKIGFIEVTSQSLLKEGQIEFPAAVAVDLPVSVGKAEIETALTSGEATDAEYLVIFDVALAKTRRRIGRMQPVVSEIVVGYSKEPNPEYAKLQSDLTRAQMAAQNASTNLAVSQSQYCYGLGCLANALASAAAAARRDELQQSVAQLSSRLTSTPMMIDVPVKQPYNYRVANITATKTMTVHYYVIDKIKKRYFKSTFDVTEKKKFDVAYQIAESDPNRAENAAKHHTEDDVTAWEKQASTVALSRLVGHYLENEKASKNLPDLVALKNEMLQDRNRAIATYKANTFEESRANDPRFESVVAIYMPGGGLGSGFFVKPDIVMTNYHVVREGEFTNLKMHDGQETFGKVVARDAGLDLALIKVQSRGKPVRFFDKNAIELGSTVEVIGHPRGYEFSITRGVVSAIRKLKSVNLGGGADVLQVQIDAATSPGNSGGPVFMKDYVISVVSWGRIDTGSENLNFTIHHSEAQRFLRESTSGS